LDTGELVIRGIHVALGYYNNFIDTSQKFLFYHDSYPIHENFKISSRDEMDERNISLYNCLGFKTGDLVKESLDGNHLLTWIGRKDWQVSFNITQYN
jgi:acyl-CoA synthetase (AMP-forming)/AMP-acid ligase II